MQSVGWGDNSGVVSLLYFCGRPIFDWQKGGEGRSQIATALADQAFDMSLRLGS